MTTATPSTALATIQPAFTDAERLALAGFLAGYRGLTREAYALDLRQFTTWCRARSLALFAVRRADIESFARELEARGRPRHRHPAALHHRRVLQVRGRRGTPDHSPAAHVRRPRVDYESHAAALDRNELGALLVAAGLGSPPEHALISLLALNALADHRGHRPRHIEHLGLERGHRTLMTTHGIGSFHGCSCVGDDELRGITREHQGAEQDPAAIRRRARRENAELCFTPANASWADPIEAQSGPVRTFVMGGSDHRNHPAGPHAAGPPALA